MYTYDRKHYANICIIQTNPPSCIPGKKLTPDAPGLLRCFQAHHTANKYHCSGMCLRVLTLALEVLSSIL